MNTRTKWDDRIDGRALEFHDKFVPMSHQCHPSCQMLIGLRDFLRRFDHEARLAGLREAREIAVAQAFYPDTHTGIVEKIDRAIAEAEKACR